MSHKCPQNRRVNYTILENRLVLVFQPGIQEAGRPKRSLRIGIIGHTHTKTSPPSFKEGNVMRPAHDEGWLNPVFGRAHDNYFNCLKYDLCD